MGQFLKNLQKVGKNGDKNMYLMEKFHYKKVGKSGTLFKTYQKIGKNGTVLIKTRQKVGKSGAVLKDVKPYHFEKVGKNGTVLIKNGKS